MHMKHKDSGHLWWLSEVWHRPFLVTLKTVINTFMAVRACSGFALKTSNLFQMSCLTSNGRILLISRWESVICRPRYNLCMSNRCSCVNLAQLWCCYIALTPLGTNHTYFPTVLGSSCQSGIWRNAFSSSASCALQWLFPRFLSNVIVLLHSM